MTKQEEIKSGISEIAEEYWYSSLMVTRKVLEYLHSQGVVIKVDKEMPHGTIHCDMLKAGYVPVEPLIKEG